MTRLRVLGLVFALVQFAQHLAADAHRLARRTHGFTMLAHHLALALDQRAQLRETRQADGAVERLEVHHRAPGAEREVEAMAVTRALELDRKRRLDVAAECRHL